MIVLELEEVGDTSVSCAAVDVSEDYYAMMDSGTNAIIVPLCPDIYGEIAECRVPSSIVQGPIAQVLDYRLSEVKTLLARLCMKSRQAVRLLPLSKTPT